MFFAFVKEIINFMLNLEKLIDIEFLTLKLIHIIHSNEKICDKSKLDYNDSTKESATNNC